MILAVGFGLLGLTAIFAIRARAPQPRTLGHHVAKNLLALLVPATLVAFYYAALIGYFSSRVDDETTLARLVELEQRLGALTAFAKQLAIPVPLALGILFVLLVASLWSAARARDSDLLASLGDRTLVASSWVSRYGKIVGFATAVLSLVSSLTILGSEAGDELPDLELRVKQVRQGYADYQAQKQDLLRGAARLEALDDHFDEAPETYRFALHSFRAAHTARRSVRRKWSQATRDYDVHVAELERSVVWDDVQREERTLGELDESAGRVPLEAIESRQGEWRPGDPRFDVMTEEQLSAKRLELLNEDLAGWREELRERLARSPWRKHLEGIHSKLLGLLVSHQHVEVLQRFVEAHPLVKPLVQVVEGVAKDLAAAHVEHRIDQLVQQATLETWSPDGPSQRVGAVQQILDQRVGSRPNFDAERAAQLAREQLAEQAHLAELDARLDGELGRAREAMRDENALLTLELRRRWEVAHAIDRPRGSEALGRGTPDARYDRAFEGLLDHAASLEPARQRELLAQMKEVAPGFGARTETADALAAVARRYGASTEAASFALLGSAALAARLGRTMPVPTGRLRPTPTPTPKRTFRPRRFRIRR